MTGLFFIFSNSVLVKINQCYSPIKMSIKFRITAIMLNECEK